MHTAEPIVPCPSPSELETAVVKLRKYKLSGSDQIRAELIPAGGETMWSEINKLSNSIWNKEELPSQLKEYVSVPVYKRARPHKITLVALWWTKW
jgi:hypothetical protein